MFLDCQSVRFVLSSVHTSRKFVSTFCHKLFWGISPNMQFDAVGNKYEVIRF